MSLRRSSRRRICRKAALVAFTLMSCVAHGQVDDRDAFDRGSDVTASSAASLRTQLRSDPNNRDLRLEILGHDAAEWQRLKNPVRSQLIPEIEWLIGDNPASPVLMYRNLHFRETDFPTDGGAYPRIVALWNLKVAERPKDVAVLRNVTRSFLTFPISVSYAARLRVVDPYDTEAVIGAAIAIAKMISTVQNQPTGTPGLEGLATLTTTTITFFSRTSDAALVGTTGKALVDLAAGQPLGSALPSAKQGRLFLERAHILDPANLKWQQAIVSPEATSTSSPALQHLYGWLEEEDLWHARVVPLPRPTNGTREVPWQEAGLRKYSHVFGHDVGISIPPPGSKASNPSVLAAMQGLVALDLEIDEAGLVRRVTPLSGVAQNIGLVREEVSKWRFQPLIVDGRPTAFHTTTKVACNKIPFGLLPPRP